MVPSACRVEIHDQFRHYNPTPTGGVFFDRTVEFDYISGPAVFAQPLSTLESI